MISIILYNSKWNSSVSNIFDSFSHKAVSQLFVRIASLCCYMLDVPLGRRYCSPSITNHWALTRKIYLWISSSRSIWWGQCWCCDRKLLTWSRCKDKRSPPTQLQTVDDCSNNCRHIQEHCENKEVLISLVFNGKWNSKDNTPKTSVFKKHSINLHSGPQTRYFSYSNISTCCQVNPCPLVAT